MGIEKIKKVKIPKVKGKKFVEEFKEFALKGNIIDMAVGVVIGTAFGKIVSSLVSDIIMPVISVLTGSIDLTNLAFTKEFTDLSGKVTKIMVPYGKFLQNVLDFLLIALSIFVVIKLLSKAKGAVISKEEEDKKEEETKKEEEKNENILYHEQSLEVLKEIKELLEKKK